jgi:hypothetical protein
MGSTISPAIHVWVTDVGGRNRVTTATNAITIAITPGYGAAGASLNGTTTTSAVSGDAIFNNLSIDQIGTGYRLTAMAASLTQIISLPFDVSPP